MVNSWKFVDGVFCGVLFFELSSSNKHLTYITFKYFIDTQFYHVELLICFAFQVLQEEEGYDLTMFIADFGGSLGFLLGVSILSVLEVLEVLIVLCYRHYNKEKAKRDQIRIQMAKPKQDNDKDD